jgi:dolichol-phosphate mannosyltransferase
MTTKNNLVSVILPTFNERENIIPLVEGIHKAVTATCEIIIVDDNSTDGTISIVNAYIKKSKKNNIRLIVRKSDHGLTKSIQEGIDNANGSIVVWMDADLSMPPEDIPRLLKKIYEGYDLSIGSRFAPGGKQKQIEKKGKDAPLPIILSKILNTLTRYFIRIPVTDFTSGFITIKKNVLERIRLRGDYGEYFINLVTDAHRQGFSITEIPYICYPRLHGESKTGNSLIRLFVRGTKYIRTVITASCKNSSIHTEGDQ